MDINGLHQLIGYLREDFKLFKKNDFGHLRDKVDKLFWVVITGLLATLGGLVLLIVRQFS